ncbi:MAG: CaiB/BaiF CoA transferase family protein [Candidatus Helarchaeota archaeon]
MSHPLQEIRVLDLTRLAPGPYATMILGDLGADIIKIEDTKVGDYVRWRKPFTKNSNDENENLYFISLNRNKRSLTLDLKTVEGQQIFYRLAKTADVLIESFRPGVVDRLKIDYETLRVLNSKLIYCSLTGYGQSGPYAALPGHDLNYISISGLGAISGVPEAGPRPLGTQVADFGGAMSAVIAILSALIERQKSQIGQYIDVAMFETPISWMTGVYADFFSSGRLPKVGAERLTGDLPNYNVYETKDGKFVAIGSLEAKFWKETCKMLKMEQFAGMDPSSDEHKQEIFEVLKSKIKKFSRDELIEHAKNVDACITPILTLDEVLSNEHVLSREVFFEHEHPRVGKIRQVRLPIKFSRSETGIHHHSPAFGEHSEEILRELGYTQVEFDEFRKKGII